VIQVPLVSVGDEQQTVGFGIFGHEFIEWQIGETERFAAFWASAVATDDCEECLWIYCECSASVGVKGERYIRLNTL
jgi:hypothetical protein